jgi:hypothetical protein
MQPVPFRVADVVDEVGRARRGAVREESAARLDPADPVSDLHREHDAAGGPLMPGSEFP